VKEISSREFMYIGGILVLPIIMLFKGLVLYFLCALALSLVLMFFDPLFKRFRKLVEGADKFIATILATGIVASGIAVTFPNFSTGLVLCWSLFYIVCGIKMSSKIEAMNNKVNESGSNDSE
jgi:predicted PurR-regulated permease PerM